MKPLTAMEVATQIRQGHEARKAAELEATMSTEAFLDIYAAVQRMLDANELSVCFETGVHPFEDLKMALAAMRSLGYAVDVVVPNATRPEMSHLAVRVTVSIPEEVV